MHDEWHIRIEREYLDPAAGSGARARERDLAAGKGGIRRFLETVLDVPTPDRNWRRGAEGEERVAARLARKLDDRWVVVHDLTIGTRGANLDHLVIGPAGVFTLNTKNLKGKVLVRDRAILHNGTNHGFLPKARNEARKVSERLAQVTGRPVHVRGVIVFTGPAETVVTGMPTDVRVIGYRRLPAWLQGLPEVLPAGEALRIERAARDPRTWGSTRSRKEPTGAPHPVADRPAATPPRSQASATDGAPATSDVTVRRWTRYGLDRFYANDADGTRLGYIEVSSGEVVLEVRDPSGVVGAQLRAARRGLGPVT